MDNDGWLDLFIANGHVYEGVEKVFPDTTYKQINSLFHNERRRQVRRSDARGRQRLTVPHAGRGAAFADFENNGNMDVVVANNGDPPLLLHNSGGAGNHFVNFKLVGTKSNRDAMGARLRAAARRNFPDPRNRRRRQLSFAERSARAFRPGPRDQGRYPGSQWPSGGHQVFHNVEPDKFYVNRRRQRTSRDTEVRAIKNRFLPVTAHQS